MNKEEAWKAYAQLMDMPDLKGFDYTRGAVEHSFYSGWMAAKQAVFDRLIQMNNSEIMLEELNNELGH